ncbi:MAG: tRNA lysidine(34) synthetase TilS [Flavobacteriales bacterium]|nr:tRNA lysidine(34) synthetase TilS [Flavobacteriales bacterium]
MRYAMIDKVRHTIREHGLLMTGEAVWVAVSGGVDSMVLLHVLQTLGHPCRVAHVDHGLRGEASDGDRAFVEAYCAEQGIPIDVVRVDVKAGAAATGESKQMAARALRRTWFHELIERGPRKLATAHHADDAIETFFMGLIRGMGARGWGSIPVHKDGIIRPLIAVTRDEILAYARAHDIRWREDASNTEEAYLRNRVRHELLPMLERWRPGTQRTIARNVRLFGELDHLARAAGEVALNGITPESDGTLRVSMDRILGSTPVLVLHHLLRGLGFHPDRLDDILQAMREGRTGARFPGEGVEVFVDRHTLVLAPYRSHPTWVIPAPDAVPADAPIRIVRCAAPSIASDASRSIAWLDADRISFPLELRPWRTGDRMRPAGLGGSKLISDILTDAKVPRDTKEQAYVLADAERILWLCGWRLSEGVKATSDCANILRVEWSGN